MSATRSTVVLLAAALLAPGVVSAADPTFAARLAAADELKTSDPPRFRQSLAELEAVAAQATERDRQHLQLLRAYGMLAAGETRAAMSLMRELVAVSVDPALRYRAGALLANAYAVTREFEEGLRAIEAAMSLLPQVADRRVRHQGQLSAGVLYNQVGEFTLGRKYADSVLADQPDGRSRCIAGNLRLEAALGAGTALTEAVIVAAIADCEAQREPILAGFSRTYLARMWFSQGRVVEAIDLLQQHLPEVTRTAYPRLIGEYHSMLAEYWMSRGDIQAAERHAKAAIAYSAAIASALPLVVAYRTLYDIAVLREDPVVALQYYRQFAEADKAHFGDVKSREMAYQVVRHQAMQQTQQIALLNNQNQVLQLQQRVQEQSAQNSRLLMVLLVLLAATIALWAYRTKRMQVSLRRMAETDALTGVANRHFFTQRAEAALAECARSGETAALVMFDLDHFKQVNDRYGHAVGDWVLQRVAEACSRSCRGIDAFGRLGGEEFAILLIGCDARSAKRLADDCRVRLSGIDTSTSGHAFRITASFGVSTTDLSGYDLARLISHADRMLYRGKEGGRNRVEVYEVPVATAPPEALRDVELPLADAASGSEPRKRLHVVAS